MNGPNNNSVEQDLQRLRPAAPPAELMQKLRDARPVRLPQSSTRTVPPLPWWSPLLRWLVPATAVLVLALLVLSPRLHQERAQNGVVDAAPAVKADEVEIDQQLLNSFDTVARLPGGEPVRFRCREWLDEVTLRDTQRGIVIEQRMPRVEVVPVRFETY